MQACQLTKFGHDRAATSGSGKLLSRLSPRVAGRLLWAALAAIALMTVGASLLPHAPAGAAAERRYVDDEPGCGGKQPCYPTIQAAVDAALDGEIVQVLPGRYTETVLVQGRHLTFEGPGAGSGLDADDPVRQALWSGLALAEAQAKASTGDLAGAHARMATAVVAKTLTDSFVHAGSWNASHHVSRHATDSGAPLRYLATDSVALTVDGRKNGLTGTAVTGFRFLSSTAGVRLLGPYVGSNVPPPGRAEGGTDPPAILVDGNLFRLQGTPDPDPVNAGATAKGAVVAVGTRGLLVRNAQVQGGPAGIVWVGGADGMVDGGAMIGLRGPGIFAGAVTGTLVISGVAVSGGAETAFTAIDPAQLLVTGSRFVGNARGIRLVATSALPPGARWTIGGDPASANSLENNRGPALALENRGAGPDRMPEVLATYNRWGSAYVPGMEAAIWHRPDDPALPLVRFLPALGTPAELGLAAETGHLPADGVTESPITATVRDAGGMPVPDGTLVRLATDMGTLAAPGTAAEAEGLDASGEWGIYGSQTFGPFSGTGYRRSRQAGSQLTWRFDAPALLVRYGQVGLELPPDAAGVFEVQVDGTSQGLITTTGATTTWVERVVAVASGPGPHTAVLTVRSGEVNLDGVVAGLTTRGGQAVTRLRAPERLGPARLEGIAYGADGPVTSTLTVDFVPGPPAKLDVRAERVLLPAGGLTTTVTATVRDAFDRLTGDGLGVQFAANLGTVSPTLATVQGGRAQTVLTSREQKGRGEVTAILGSLFASTAVTIGAGSAATVKVTPAAGSLPANSTATVDLEIVVKDAWGEAVADGTPLLVTTTLGTVEPEAVETVGGTARVRLRAGNEAGTAHVRATAGESDDMGGTGGVNGAAGEASVTLLPLDVRLTKTVEPAPPAAIVAGEPLIFSLAFSNEGDGTVYDLELEDVLPTGVLSPSIYYDGRVLLQSLDKCPSCRWRIGRLAPGEGGVVQVSGVVDPALRPTQAYSLANTARLLSPKAALQHPDFAIASAEVQVLPVAKYTVTVEAPLRLPVGGATGRVVARVMDTLDRPVRDDIEVYFSTDLGIIYPVTAKTKGGFAEATLSTGRSTGLATVKAVLSVDNRAGLAQTLFDPGPPDSILLQAGRERLMVGGETMPITVTLRDAFGNGVPNTLVRFEADQGSLAPESAQTNADGQAVTNLRSGYRAVTALVTARAQALSQRLEVPFDPGPVANIEAIVTPARLRIGSRAAITATVTDGFGNPIAQTGVAFSSNLGNLRPRLGVTDEQGRAYSIFSSTHTGTGPIRASAEGVVGAAVVTVERGELYLPVVRKGR